MAKTYGMKAGTLKMNMIFESIGLIGGLFLLFLTGRINAPVITSSIILLIVGFWYKYRALIILGDTHFEMKVALPVLVV